MREGGDVGWPIDYEELAPCYSKIERDIALCGHAGGVPDLPDEEFLPSAPMKCSDEIQQRGAACLGVKPTRVRKATLTQVSTPPRPPCRFYGTCMAGCDMVAKYNSADVHLYSAAQETGRLEIRSYSIAYELAMDECTSTAQDARFLDWLTGKQASACAHIVILGCACDPY